jgi:hypothetical protein
MTPLGSGRLTCTVFEAYWQACDEKGWLDGILAWSKGLGLWNKWYFNMRGRMVELPGGKRLNYVTSLLVRPIDYSINLLKIMTYNSLAKEGGPGMHRVHKIYAGGK